MSSRKQNPMLGLLSKVVPYGNLLKYGAIALVIAAGGAYVWHLHARVTAQHATISGLKGDLVKVSAIAQQNADAAKQAQQAAARDQAALAVVSSQQVATSQRLGSQLAHIHGASASKANAKVPDLLWATIRSLSP